MKNAKKKAGKTILMTTRKKGEAPMDEYLKHSTPKEMSIPEKDVLSILLPESPVLPYPLYELSLAYGEPAQAYRIPEEKLGEVLRELYPFENCPDLDDICFDLHERKFFKIREYLVIRERNRNMLVSPYYASTGGMVVDWMPEDSIDTLIEEVASRNIKDVEEALKDLDKIAPDDSDSPDEVK